MSILISRPWRRSLPTALAAVLLPAALAAQNPAPVIAVGKITATGGNRVRGVEDGVIFQRRFDEKCFLSDPPPAVKPVAASLEQEMKLEVELITCPAGEKPPGVQCRAEINGVAVSEWIPNQGALLTVPVKLPDATGLYGIRLACLPQAMGAFPTRLFLTYAPPRPMVDPPDPDWYEMACNWGEGLTRTSTEQEVADNILAALFHHGQRQWEYGLCEIHGDRCVLSDGTWVSLAGLRCDCAEGVCTMDWTELVRAAGGLRFSDCYQFSSTFEYVVATMGVGGMVEEEELGAHGEGFMSRGTTRSLDPAFGGNLMCGKKGKACAFTFYNHDLRRRGDLIYDATFGGIYISPDELILESVVENIGNLRRFTKLNACKGAYGYGNFRTYRELEPLGQCQQGSGARFGKSPVRVHTLPVEGSPGPEALAVDVEVIVEEQGSYSIEGGVYCHDGRVVTLRPKRGRVDLRSTARISGPPGTYWPRLIFSGGDLNRSRSRDCAPYELRAHLTPGQADQGSLRTPIDLSLLDLSSLGDGAAELGPAEALKLAWVSGGRILRATLPVKVHTAGFFAVEARLAYGKKTLSYAGDHRELLRETKELAVDFPLPVWPFPTEGLEISIALHGLDPLRPVHGLRIPNVNLPPP